MYDSDADGIGMTQALFCSTVLSICNLCSYKFYHKNCTETPQPTKYIIANRAVFAAESAIALDRDIRAIPHGIASPRVVFGTAGSFDFRF